MQPPLSGELDYVFGQAMLTLRVAIGLTQEELAAHLGVSRRSIGAWEAGSKYSKATHLQAFIALGAEHRAFGAGHEAEEIRALWRTARQKELLDEVWLCGLLAPPKVEVVGRARPSAEPAAGPRID